MEDAGLFSMLIITDEYRENVFNMKQEELNIALECRRWLQEQNTWIRVYKTNLEKLQRELTTTGGDTTGSLLACLRRLSRHLAK